MSERRILIDPTTGRPILMAPARQGRPMLTAGEAKTERCPFCEHREDQTPAEIDAVRVDGTSPGSPGWSVRAFANLYPACEHHEVIAEGTAHTENPAALDAALWADAIALYRRRIDALESRDDVRCAFLFKNVGRRAGASIAHNHSQLIGLPMLPPRLELELAHRTEPCVHCDEVDSAEREGRQVFASSSHVAYSPRQPKLPFELRLAARDHAAAFGDDAQDLAVCLHGLFGALDAAFGAPPFNLFLHRVPSADFHWHWELQPRTGNLAGLELGGDMYINSIPAEVAAARLRDELD